MKGIPAVACTASSTFATLPLGAHQNRQRYRNGQQAFVFVEIAFQTVKSKYHLTQMPVLGVDTDCSAKQRGIFTRRPQFRTSPVHGNTALKRSNAWKITRSVMLFDRRCLLRRTLTASRYIFVASPFVLPLMV